MRILVPLRTRDGRYSASVPTKHLFFAKSRGPRDAFVRDVFTSLVPSLSRHVRGAWKLDLTEKPNPRVTILPLRRDNLVMVSTWGDVVPGDVVGTLEQAYGSAFGYRVEASLPADYARDWADGGRSPGDVLLTLLSKNEKLTYDAFMAEWHGRHTPKAMRIHPMWRYARNVVAAKITPDAPTFEGVVEEHYRTLSDITNPVRMFGGPLRFLPNMVEVGLHANHFLDLSKTENYLLTEWHMRSGDHS
jgi:hypothetical protein